MDVGRFVGGTPGAAAAVFICFCLYGEVYAT